MTTMLVAFKIAHIGNFDWQWVFFALLWDLIVPRIISKISNI